MSDASSDGLHVRDLSVRRGGRLVLESVSLDLRPGEVTCVVRLGDAIRTIVRRGIGVLLIEQFTTLALALASRAYVMERGRVVFSGTSDVLRSRPGGSAWRLSCRSDRRP